MKLEILQVTWKFIRRKGYGRTPETYCSYIVENKNHKHKLKTVEGTKLFELLQKNTVSANEKYENKIVVDGMYQKGKLIYVTNPRIL